MYQFINHQTNYSNYTKGQTWFALKKALSWYKIAKVLCDNTWMPEYAKKIRTL